VLSFSDTDDACLGEYPRFVPILVAVLADCTDFRNEKTLLMYLGEQLGVEVDRSTKSHMELAGEGIEYSWGRAKCVY
jgi:hypothetical protein